jgi:hypothetical protein
MKRVEAALAYKEAGWRLNILHRSGKEPVFRNWQHRDPTATEIEYHVDRLHRNFGLILDSVIVCDKDGRDREADLFVRRIGPFYSPHVVTTRKGKHYYEALPEGIEARTKLRFRGMMLDLLTGPSRYVVGPGSVVVKDGEPFTYELKGEIVAPGALPQARVALVNLLTETTEKVNQATTFPRLIGNVRERIQGIACPEKYVLKVPSVQGQHGSKGLVRVVCVFRDAGRTAQETFEFLSKVWNEQCAVPKWSDAEIARAVTRFFNAR